MVAMREYTIDEPLRVGIVGGGYIGTVTGIEFLNDGRAEVAALADIDDETLEETGDRLGVPSAARYREYYEMLASEALDAVCIGTPHTLHYEQITSALDEGLHVLCDKPLTTNLEHAHDIVQRAEGSDRTLMVGYQRHLNEAFISARERWRDPSLEPRFITAEITQNWTDRFTDTWRTNPDFSGGGYLYDTGSHLLDAVLWTTGLRPTSVTADMSFIDPDQLVDERASLTIEFENGATANVSVFGDAPCVREHIHIWDDEGAVYLDGRQWEPRRIQFIDEESRTVEPYLDRDQQRTKAGAFIDSIHHGEQPPATARDALVVTAVTEAAYEAARTGERVPVDR